MDARRGRRLAVAGAVAALLVLAASGLAARTWILERYYLQRLAAGDEKAQHEAIRRLGEIRAARAALPIFEHMQRHPSCGVWLGRLGPPAVPLLIGALDENDPEIVSNACLALSQLGPAAGIALPALERTLKDKSNESRYFAPLAMGMIGPAISVLPSLVQAIWEDENPAVQLNAAVGLIQLGPPGEDALLKAIDESDGVMGDGRIIEALAAAHRTLLQVSRDEASYAGWFEFKVKTLPPALLESLRTSKSRPFGTAPPSP